MGQPELAFEQGLFRFFSLRNIARVPHNAADGRFVRQVRDGTLHPTPAAGVPARASLKLNRAPGRGERLGNTLDGPLAVVRMNQIEAVAPAQLLRRIS